MQITEKTKGEVIIRANQMSDFLKIEYLEGCIKVLKQADIMIYCLYELSRLYESKLMYDKTLAYLNTLEPLLTDNSSKIKVLLKEVSIFIKSGKYELVEYPYNKALKLASETQKFEIKKNLIRLYQSEAAILETKRRYSHLQKIYEASIKYLYGEEKNEIKRKLVEIYKKLGKIKESIELERSMTSIMER